MSVLAESNVGHPRWCNLETLEWRWGSLTLPPDGWLWAYSINPVGPFAEVSARALQLPVLADPWGQLQRDMQDAERWRKDLDDSRTTAGFLEWLEGPPLEPESTAVRAALITLRRAEFTRERTDLLLGLIDRDGYVCRGCGAGSDLTVDHIHPLSRGGSDALENLQLLCGSCNSRKGDRI